MGPSVRLEGCLPKQCMGLSKQTFTTAGDGSGAAPVGDSSEEEVLDVLKASTVERAEAHRLLKHFHSRALLCSHIKKKSLLVNARAIGNATSRGGRC